MDKLDKLFKTQAALNDVIFKKQGIRTVSGRCLNTKYLLDCGEYIEGGANSTTNQWLKNFTIAMKDETRELEEELLWKWWSKDSLNMQNIRVEIIDQLHFWISLAMTAGMDADKVFDIYMQKNRVNLERQENGYSKENKNEDDNKGVM